MFNITRNTDRVRIENDNEVIELPYGADGAYLLNAPCGCYECDHKQQPGHRYCNPPTKELLRAEEIGAIWRQLDSGGWYWSTTN